ncbi:hypothetical protein HPB48_000049 [Haemaphysalis longicornis]|uniref:Cullin N-terminal domain-containing protein n=1 Tax=Haemaphysalis longicornis TaxID=44386 RepID=A0A9J6FW65_HAELO|nr:hypothetical protein HPB48_000049 [Haemaphysalis longicornis]
MLTPFPASEKDNSSDANGVEVISVDVEVFVVPNANGNATASGKNNATASAGSGAARSPLFPRIFGLHLNRSAFRAVDIPHANTSSGAERQAAVPSSDQCPAQANRKRACRRSHQCEALGQPCDSFLELGVNEKDPNAKQPLLSVYKETFEHDFLAETERFYSRLSAKYFEQRPVPKYVTAALRCISVEEHRARSYMHESTLQPLLKIYDKVLVEDHTGNLSAAFQELLRKEKDVDLGLL